MVSFSSSFRVLWSFHCCPSVLVKMNTAMKAMTKKSKLVGDIGELMLSCLDGERGEQFRRAAAAFCQHQQYALEALKLRQKKDQKLAQFLQARSLRYAILMKILAFRFVLGS